MKNEPFFVWKHTWYSKVTQIVLCCVFWAGHESLKLTCHLFATAKHSAQKSMSLKEQNTKKDWKQVDNSQKVLPCEVKKFKESTLSLYVLVQNNLRCFKMLK